jgi:hypothetical protein
MCIYFLTADQQIQVLKSTERHFFHYTERTYHCIIMHIFKKQKQKEKQREILSRETNRRKQETVENG